ncbi:MAG: hypothetical protein JWN32_4144, partial [Solirubrobacterales bacterium]|nr:hypothetical protein [Solirubrobacterales bacterium]
MSVLERPSTEQLLAALRARLPGFVPAWHPETGGPGDALLRIWAEYLRALAERVAEAPDKNELAFLDQLGLDVLPAQAARAPVVFTTIPGGGDGHAPAGTRVAAKGPDPARQLVFETERPVGLAAARLAEVVTLWPGRDAYGDHGADALGGRPFRLWDGLEPVAHELYVAHDLHLALAGSASVGVDVELAPGGSEALALDWSWWDGEGWRAFKEVREEDESGWSLDTTRGLTRSGRTRLATDCGASKPRVVGGWSSHWLRARTTRPLPPDPTRRLAEIDRISLRTVIDRRLDEQTCTGGLLPDSAFAGAEQLDPTKTFFPMGKAPSADTAFYLACGEAFARPGAHVEICFDRPETEQEKIDALAAQYAKDVTSAVAHVIASAKQQSLAVQKIAEAIIGMAPANDGGATTATGKKSALATATGALVDMSGLGAVATAAKELADSLAAISITLATLPTTVVDVPASKARIQSAANDAAEATRRAANDIARWGETAAIIAAGMIGGAPAMLLAGGFDLFTKSQEGAKAVASAASALKDLGVTSLTTPIATLQSDIAGANIVAIPGHADDIVNIVNAPWTVDLAWKQDNLPDFTSLTTGRQTAKTRGIEAAKAGDQALIELTKLSPLQAALAAGKEEPELDPAVLAWEYWNGDEWREAVPKDPGDDGMNLRASGRVAFDVPRDWEPSTVGGVEQRWLRGRLVSGVFGKLTLVSWKDEDHQVRYLPIIEPRPPQLDRLAIGYLWESRPAAPQHVVTRNDFAWEEHTEEAARRGGTFTPFRPVEDATPALYLGFDGRLPADELGVLLDVEEVLGEDAGPALTWDAHDGTAWREIAVEDETGALAVPGIVHVPWPGGEWSRPAATTVPEAGLARFGTPRSWLRARLRSDGEPRRAIVRGVDPNAVWATQVETVVAEILGSSTGEPSQAFFVTRTPVLVGEEVEVRELEGERARVEYPLLVSELAAAGIAEADLGVERDPRTGHETAVWVPWQRRPNLGFSGPADRHYVTERTRGRVQFGDGVHGRIPVVARDNVRMRRYRSGGGTQGNVPAGAIAQVVSGVLVASVTNPR